MVSDDGRWEIRIRTTEDRLTGDWASVAANELIAEMEALGVIDQETPMSCPSINNGRQCQHIGEHTLHYAQVGSEVYSWRGHKPLVPYVDVPLPEVPSVNEATQDFLTELARQFKSLPGAPVDLQDAAKAYLYAIAHDV